MTAAAAASSLTDSLHPQQLSILKEAFQLFDKNGDGKINTDMLGTVMRTIGFNPTDAELQDMINEVDLDRNGTIEFGEFLTMMTSKVDSDPYADLRAAFEVFDKDSNGLIDRDELRCGMKCIGEELSEHELDLLWKQADMDKDGFISLDEFIRMMTT